jgi:hypothetical protein
MNNISISNVYAEVPATKPDAGYNYEGPVEDMPRNISPASIAGMPDVPIENVRLRNIEIHYPGGGNPSFARVGLDELDKVLELKQTILSFQCLRSCLPGDFISVMQGHHLENVTLVCGKRITGWPLFLMMCREQHSLDLR